MIIAIKQLRDFVKLSVGLKKYTNTPQKDNTSAERKQCQIASKLMKETEKHNKLLLHLCLTYSLCSEYIPQGEVRSSRLDEVKSGQVGLT
jgi:hypothetical protein